MNQRPLEVLKDVLANKEGHFFFKCDALADFRSASGLSERALSVAIGKSKSEVHRMLDVSRTSPEMREAVLRHGTDYHVLVRYWQTTAAIQSELCPLILSGKIRRHKQIKDFLQLRTPNTKELLERKMNLLEAQIEKCRAQLKECA